MYEYQVCLNKKNFKVLLESLDNVQLLTFFK